MTENKPARKSREGNKNGIKLKDSDLRQEAYKSFCAHLAAGNVKKSWWFEKGEYLCSWQTMERYIEENPLEFNPIQLELAISKGYTRWEKVVGESAEGKNQAANTASLQMLMRNKYGWDKKDKDESETTITIKHQYATSDNTP